MHALLLSLALHASDAGVPGPMEEARRPARYAASRRAFTHAISSGALDEARAALEERRAAAPGRVDLAYDLACLEARAGRIGTAFAALEPLAVDPRSGAMFVSSVRTGAVWRRLGGRWTVWARPGPPGHEALALGIDTTRRVLHVTTAAMPYAEGFRKEEKGRSALVTLRLEDGAELARYEPPGDGPHVLGDLTVGPDGSVFASDALGGTVDRLVPGSGRLEPLVPPHTFSSPQTPARAADGRTLYVPDYTLGLFALPLDGGPPQPVPGPADLVTGGIDGMSLAPGGLVAVQNGIVRNRIVRLWLSDDGRRIVRWSVLARGEELGDPTHVVATPRGSLALIDSGWNRFTDEGRLRPNAAPARPRVLRLDVR